MIMAVLILLQMRIQEKVTYEDLDSASIVQSAPPLKLNLGKVNSDLMNGLFLNPWTVRKYDSLTNFQTTLVETKYSGILKTDTCNPVPVPVPVLR